MVRFAPRFAGVGPIVAALLLSLGLTGIAASGAAQADDGERDDEAHRGGLAVGDAFPPDETVAEPAFEGAADGARDEVPDDNSAVVAEEEPPPVDVAEGGWEPEPTVVEQVGVGSRVPYGAQNVLEVGGSGSAFQTGSGFYGRIAPFAGWFIIDGLELTYSNEVNLLLRDGEDLRVAFIMSIEPSLHLPLIDHMWLAIGAAGGVVYNGVDAGAVLSPRVGIDLLVGRSGMLHISALATLATTDLMGPTATPEQSSQWRAGADIAYAALF
jgi:hypothetical protein